ncbi:hypothetical protein SDC9_62852 [bioreactor metagenome]|uniref:Uncharacterized protein n=1 Tax=bioreactor metagenome TaxID=1076179 RepID=A0A644XKV2_9ZZZZ
MPHQHLRFQSLDGLQRDAHNDDDGSAADGEGRDADDSSRDNGQERQNHQEDGAEEGNLGEYLVDKFGGGSARTEAGDKPAVFLEIVRNLNGVKLHCRIEVTESHDQQRVDNHIGYRSSVEEAEEIVPAGARHLGRGDKHADGGRQGGNGLGKDDRQNAGHIHLHGDVGGLAAVHLPANHTLCVLHRNAALGVGDEHDEDHDEQHAHKEQRHKRRVELGQLVAGRDLSIGECNTIKIVGYAGDHGGNHRGHTGDDAGEQNDGNTVADAEFRDLLTQPHQEGGASREGQNDDDGGPDAALLNKAVAVNEGVVAVALEQGDAHGGVPGDGRNLLPALLAPLLLQPLQRRDGDGQQLNDDGAVDIRLDGQRKDRSL